MSRDPEAEARAHAAAAEALRAGERGDLPAAARLVAVALAHDPMNGEWLELLERIRRAVDDPRALLALEGQTPFSVAAVHAYLLARSGGLVESVTILFAVATAEPEVGYLAWVTGWLGVPGAVEAFPAEALERLLRGSILPFLRAVPASVDASDPSHPNVDACALVLELFGRHHSDHPLRAVVATLANRRLGRTDAALREARTAVALDPGFATYALLANVHRERDEPTEALEAYEAALATAAVPSDEVAARLDIADLLLEQDRASEALDHYERVLALEPLNRWARGSALGARAVATSREEAWQALREFAEAHPEDERSRALLRLCPAPRS